MVSRQIRRLLTRQVGFSSPVRMDAVKTPPTFMCIDDYDVIGFDIDHTLAKYNIPNLFNLVHDAFTQTLVDIKGYDSCLLVPFETGKDLCSRGLVVDIKRGNFLKVGKNGVILRANHGTKAMSEIEVREIYGPQKLFEHYEKFINTADNIKAEDGKGFSYFLFDNFFDIIASGAIARMVDQLDRQAGKRLETYNMFGDIQAAFNSTYHYRNFAEKTGGFFSALEENPNNYIEKLQTDVKSWIKKLRQKGKVLFLMTSSYVDFVTFTMNHIMGSDWRDSFEVIVTYSKKPSFFHSTNHFRRLDGTSEKEPVIDLEKGQTYSQGNLATFNKLLTKLTGKDDPKVLYFGDSLRSDIVPSKKFAKWDTVFVYEEMEAEIADIVQYCAATSDEDDEPDEPAKKRLKTGGGRVSERKSRQHTREREFLSSARWGSFLVDDKYGQLEGTMYGELMRKHTNVVIPHLSHIANLPLDHKFSCVTELDTSTEGFFPKPPEIFRTSFKEKGKKENTGS